METSLNRYITGLLPRSQSWVHHIQKQAEQESVPIMDEVSINFLMQLIRIKQPKQILEIGTAIGYSALRMHDGCPETKITTIERDSDHFEKAKANIQQQNKANNIHVLHGDALDQIEKISRDHHPFDLILIDAAKGKYKQFFTQAAYLLAGDGIIVTDNVLFKGYVVDQQHAPLRHQKLAENIKSFNKWLSERTDFITTILPIGDGVALSVKTNKERT